MKRIANPNRTRKDRQKKGARSYRKGLCAETFCCLVLWSKGYRILARRVRTPMGEMDLIAVRGTLAVVVEVKARASQTASLVALLPRQRQRLVQAAHFLVPLFPELAEKTLRFDVMLVAPWRWPRHIENAFDASL